MLVGVRKIGEPISRGFLVDMYLAIITINILTYQLFRILMDKELILYLPIYLIWLYRNKNSSWTNFEFNLLFLLVDNKIISLTHQVIVAPLD